MEAITSGGVAGTVATGPMTVVMVALHRLLPPEQRYWLPPKQIAVQLLQKSGLAKYLGPNHHEAATLVGHVGYGAATGALYGLLTHRTGHAGAATGAAFGAVVWAASYLGWMPALGIVPAATREPAARNATMIASHLVWGATLGLVTRLLQRRRASDERPPVRA
jgi:uncharacterized membrane protein YagU involved in acid resistance